MQIEVCDLCEDPHRFLSPSKCSLCKATICDSDGDCRFFDQDLDAYICAICDAGETPNGYTTTVCTSGYIGVGPGLATPVRISHSEALRDCWQHYWAARGKR